jgi:class 3 adenylate cyclase
MTFDEILDQIIALLKRQGRVSYRALKRRFDLSDEYIDDLKEEILYVHESDVQADERGFTWTGDTEDSPSMPPSQPEQPAPPSPRQPDQPTQVQLPSSEPVAPDAERRQLTVMFCDLVDSTKLSSQLDPEDLRDVVRDYQTVCTEVIQRYEGHVAQLLGDGLLVYFGYPQAHEDDAQRAIRSGLGIIDAIGNLNSRLEQSKGIRLTIRIGVHTGLVVVGEMGGSGRQEQLALGETPNVAARIQGLAEPNTLVMSAETHRLTQGFFECESLGENDLRGVSQPITVYRVLGETGAQNRLDVASTRGLTPLVGREQEVGILLGRWAQSREGHGQVVLLSGEAGIGKSRLVQMLKDHVAKEPHTRMECRSSPYFTNSALYPITDFLQRMLRLQSDDTPEQKWEKLEHNLSQYRLPLDESVPLFASLLSLPVPEDHYPALNLTPQRQRQMTLEAILAIILELSERQPVLFILEDLHWTDPTTLELLELIVDQTPTASLYILLTCRPEFQPSWSHRSYLTEMTLNRLSRNQIAFIATQVAGGKTLPDEVIAQLVERTDGVPLYVEEMTKSVLESGVLKETDECYELTGAMGSLTIPTTLQDSLMARLDRLVTAKAVAQYASVVGRQFSYELLQAVSQLDESTLQRELSRLVDAELVYQRGLPPQATYFFKHALIQDTAYESLLRGTKQGYHQRIAAVLEERFPETADTQPELLAHHWLFHTTT